MHNKNYVVAALLALATLAGSAHAQQSPTAPGYGLHVQYGSAEHGTDSYTIGVTKPWDWQTGLWGTQVTGYWDLYGSRWQIDQRLDRDHTWLIGLTPAFRVRFDEGRSPWFLDAGIGITATDHLYHTQNKKFSTAFNFSDHLGVGYSFGAAREHEIQLRLNHLSNASIKKPNPGENFVQVRYAYHFGS
ncbi:acyloxyacyl hydrolase [Xylophilus sp.]|uniref:acyloxyacyl hydrolase n=1 Tax=Xylophilus sp. TaxID=2653893 RepID=UPI0013BDE3A5|nr:acyloxyacyl hydrolase [Xylophilus sp.]KAF1050135.1 MAG: Lipid A deacylase PagL [Xylophilus sp.]